MKISVELTCTPLQDEYEETIKNFILRVRASGLTVLENPLSTQVYGEYDEVMKMLKREIKDSLELVNAGIFTLKIVKTDRSAYIPSF
jgi:uncharacterized protein YqgV (UPF0045/DUF77 family)